MKTMIDLCPVPILQSPWEFDKLLDVHTELRPQKVVEIGSFYGGTLWYWTKRWLPKGVLRPKEGEFSPKMVTSVDNPIGPSDGRYDEMLRCRSMWPEWTKEIEFHDIQGDSHHPITIERVKQLHPNNDVDFLFIDGDHSYTGVMADFDNYSPLVRPGGLIVLHDVCGLPEVKQFWDGIKKGCKYTEINEPGGWGIGIIEV